MKIVIIDNGLSNVGLLAEAILSVKKEGDSVVVSDNQAEIRSATHLVLPGGGSFGDCIDALKSVNGLAEEIRKQVVIEKKPFLGTCVGMQVLASVGYEDGECPGLGLINGKVEKIEVVEGLNLPHLGWSSIAIKPNKHPILSDIKDGEEFYFSHSYHFLCQNENNVLAQAEYGSKFCAIIAKDNIFATQFLPEKSGEAGLKLLKNFLNWRP